MWVTVLLLLLLFFYGLALFAPAEHFVPQMSLNSPYLRRSDAAFDRSWRATRP